jgi:hypothetical protein
MGKREKTNRRVLNDCHWASEEKQLKSLDRGKRDVVKTVQGYKTKCSGRLNTTTMDVVEP